MGISGSFNHKLDSGVGMIQFPLTQIFLFACSIAGPAKARFLRILVFEYAGDLFECDGHCA